MNHTLQKLSGLMFCLALLLIAGVMEVKAEDRVLLPRLVAQTGHRAFILSIAVSPDGRVIASADLINTIKLWDAATGRELRTLSGHQSPVNSVVFSPNGDILASGSNDNTIKIWDVTTGKELRTLNARDFAVSIAFSPDGRTLVSGGGYKDKTIKLWDVATGKELHTLIGHEKPVNSVTFSPDGRTLASGSGDNTIKLWDVATARELHTLRGHEKAVHSVTFSMNGQILASGSHDKTIRLWNVASGKGVNILSGHEFAVYSVVFSPDEQTLASVDKSKNIKLWNFMRGKELRNISGHMDSVYSAVFFPGGHMLASGSRDKTIKLWDVITGKELRTLSGHGVTVHSVAFSPDGRTLASGGSAKTIKLWNFASGQEMHILDGHDEPVSSVVYSPDGHTLASGSVDKTIKLWETGKEKKLCTLRGHEGVVYSLAFSSDGRRLASGGFDDTIKLWDVTTCHKLLALRGHELGTLSVSFTPDGRSLASGGYDSSIKLWDVATGNEMRTSEHLEEVISVAVSADGRILASGGLKKTIKLWDATSGKELYALNGCCAVAFSPDSRTLASGSSENAVKLWDVATGKELHKLTGHNGTVTSVAFSPNGRLLASGSEDSTIRLWNPATGKLIATLAEFDDNTWAVVDPEGRYDSSGAGNNPNLHWVVGLTPIALDQLKDRYYEPGLLQKLLGYNPEPLRTVPKLEDALARLYPEVQLKLDSANPLQLNITLKEQTGGYGKVRVRLNGKELTSDARNGKLLSGKQQQLTLAINPGLLLPAENVVDVVAWNAEGHLSSPPAFIKLDGTRGRVKTGAPNKTPAEPPTLYAIVSGVALYANPDINLTFSGKDAVDFAQAITLGAKRLFGTTKVQLHLFSDDTRATPGLTVLPPSRENLQRAFSQVAKQAKPGDIFVVFLSGHGVMSSLTEGDYYYLTKDAGGLNLTDPTVRKLWGISSAELTEWIKQIPATKQMMVLDTCSAGGAIEKLTQQRAVPSSQIIALERLKDRTGFHVLAGAAADRASYETTRYGQGLLTRALLTGIKGAALRDGEFIDVARLFQYARDEVPKLAKEIGGIQAPQVASPRGDSFDIGEMKEADKRLVPLEKVREMILRGVFQDEIRMNDTIKLSTRFNQRLRAESQTAARGRLVFVDADDFPDAWSVAGRYRKTPQGLYVDVRMFRNNEPKADIKLTLTGDDSQQVEQLFGAVMEKVR